MVESSLQLQQLEAIQRGFRRYQLDPIGFFVDVLHWKKEYIWEGMENIAYSVRDNRRTVARAGHGVSKTYTLAGLALWFLYCHPPATVVTTAPTEKQVEDILWREIRQNHSASGILFGKPTNLKLDLQPESGVNWFATGFSARPDSVTREATSFQGYHNHNVFIAFDEAAAILPEIWRAAEHIGGNRMTRFIAVGNPTSSTGEFVHCFKDPDFTKLVMPVISTPNYIEGSNRIPGVYGREYEARIISKYGKDSDEYRVRVLGEISQKAAPGAYYAKQLKWLRDHGRIGTVEHNYRYPVFTVWDPGFTTAIWFIQPSPDGAWNVIRYYEASGEDMGQYAVLLDSFKEKYGYRYGQHFAPFDVDNNQYRLVAAEGLREIAWKHGIRFTTLEYETSVDDGIARTGDFLYACRFDREGCDIGLDRLGGYQQKVNHTMSNEDALVFMSHPDKNGCEHGADAFRYVSKAVKLINPEKFQSSYGPAVSRPSAPFSKPVFSHPMGM